MMQNKITSISEISDIVDRVLAKMDEPDLDLKKIDVSILSDEAFEEAVKEQDPMADPEIVRCSLGLNYRQMGGRHRILLREDTFSNIFPTYFHELGHTANFEHLGTMDEETAQVYSEALAYAFEGYAKETFNKLGHPEIFEDVTEENRLDVLEMGYIALPSSIHQEALDVLHDSLYHTCNTFEGAYKLLKDEITW